MNATFKVTDVRLPLCSHGYRSGYAHALVNGQPMRLYTSRSADSSYDEHRLDVTQKFAAGQGELDEK